MQRHYTLNGESKELSWYCIAINFEDGAVNGASTLHNWFRENYAKIKGEKVESTNEAKKDWIFWVRWKRRLRLIKVGFQRMTCRHNHHYYALQAKAKRIPHQWNGRLPSKNEHRLLAHWKVRAVKLFIDLKDVTIPIKVTGQWADPKFALVFWWCVKAKAQKRSTVVLTS